MHDHFFEITIRKSEGKWTVLGVLPTHNEELKKDSLPEALHQAATMLLREELRYGQGNHSTIDRHPQGH